MGRRAYGPTRGARLPGWSVCCARSCPPRRAPRARRRLARRPLARRPLARRPLARQPPGESAVREQAYHYLSKPVKSQELIELVRHALAAKPVPPVEVVSARSDWVELLLPCQLEVADRMHALLSRLLADLPEEVRENISYVFI